MSPYVRHEKLLRPLLFPPYIPPCGSWRRHNNIAKIASKRSFFCGNRKGKIQVLTYFHVGRPTLRASLSGITLTYSLSPILPLHMHKQKNTKWIHRIVELSSCLFFVLRHFNARTMLIGWYRHYKSVLDFTKVENGAIEITTIYNGDKKIFNVNV